MADAVVQLHGLTKYYGRARGVEELDLEVRAGEVFGLLGPNGAGKTTTLRLLMDLLRPDRGRITLFGLDATRDGVAARRRIGYLPGELALYLSMTGAQLLDHFAALRGGVDAAYRNDLATRFRLDLGRRVRALSHGNRQKLGILQAFMHRPDLLVLDEPTQGLDPLMQHEFHHLVEETKNEGRTVVLSSHNLPEVQATCDRVAMLREGRLVGVDTVEALLQRQAQRFEVRFAAPVEPAAFARLPGVRDLSVRGTRLDCLVVSVPDAFLKALARHHVLSLEAQPTDLESVFLTYYEQREASHAP